MENLQLQTFVIGLNHDTAAVDLREKFSFDPSNLAQYLMSVQRLSGIQEVLMLSTCNRTEIYIVGRELQDIITWLGDYSGLGTSEIESFTYRYSGETVFEHAARVACGLDSMVLGETQILGQLKDSYRKAQNAGTLGPNLHKLFQLAFSVAKSVRSRTEIGAHSISIAAAALNASRSVFSDLAEQSILFIGAGDMIRLCATHFCEHKFSRISFANRSLENCKALAEQFGADYFDLAALSERLHTYDIVVSCTASQTPILGKGLFEAVIKKRRHQPIVVFDLAVPRDVEMECATLDDIFLFTIDDLGEIVRDSLSHRESAIDDAEIFISDGRAEYKAWLGSRRAVSVIKLFRELGNRFTEEELEKAMLALEKDSDPKHVLRSMANSLKNKFLDRPSRALNRLDNLENVPLEGALINLFDLDNDIDRR